MNLMKMKLKDKYGVENQTLVFWINTQNLKNLLKVSQNNLYSMLYRRIEPRIIILFT